MANSAFNSLAVIAGCAVDYGLTIGATTTYAITRLALETPATAAQADTVKLGFLLFGTLFTVLGGFTAARFARANALLHGAAVGVVAVIIGALSQLSNPAASIELWNAIGIGLSVPAGIVGALLGDARD